MNFKDKLIKNLVDVGKKHRILVYPTLALIAVISAISNAVYWGRSNGKRMVASVLVMVLLFTQSLFLTSSANNGDSATSPNLSDNTSIATNSDAAYDDYYSDDDSTTDSDDADSENPDDSEENDDEDNIELFSVDEELEAQTAADSTYFNYNLYCYFGSMNDTAHEMSINEEIKDGSATVTITKAALDEAYGDDADNIEYLDVRYGDETQYFTGDSVSFTVTEDKMSDNNFYVDMKVVKVDITYYSASSYGDEWFSNSSTATENGSFETYDSSTNELTIPTSESYSYYGGNKAKLRKFYKMMSISKGVYSASKETNQVLTVQLDPNQTSATITTNWAPKTITFTLDAVSSTDKLAEAGIVTESGADQTLTGLEYSGNYSVAVFPEMNKDWASANDGYYFAGWKTVGSDVLYNDSADVADLLEGNASVAKIDDDTDTIDGGTLTGVWKYREYTLSPDSLVREYGADIGEITLKPVYKSITGQDGLADGDKFGINIPIEDLQKSGISVAYGKDVATVGNVTYYEYYKLSGNVTTITDGEQIISVGVIDLNKPANEQTTTATFTYNFTKRGVTINPSTVYSNGTAPPTKLYDGKASISVDKTAGVTGKLDGDDVSVLIEGTTSSSNINAEFIGDNAEDAKNAGKNKTLKLYGVSLTGKDKDNYVLLDGDKVDEDGVITVENCGTIVARPVTVGIREVGEDDAKCTVKYGQATPAFELYIDDDDLNSIMEADRTDWKAAIGFEDTWDSQRNSVFRDVGDYSISPNLSKTANYSPESDEGEKIAGTITVVRDEADGNYTFTGEKAEGSNYYTSISIKPTNGYTSIRACKSDTDDVTTEDDRVFYPELTIDDFESMENGTIYFQMMDDKGGITYIGSIPNMYIDHDGPVLKSVSYDENAKIFENFGGYYKPSSNDDFLKITLTYTADYSAAKTLSYYLRDANHNSTNNTAYTVVNMTDGDKDGEYKAVIPIYTGNYGQLIVRAQDEAGNYSDYNVINLKNNETVTDPESVSGYFEWMTEGTPPQITPIIVSSNGNTAAVNGTYNSLSFSVKAYDGEDPSDSSKKYVSSGLNHIKWIIYDENGKDTGYGSDSEELKASKETTHIFTGSFPGDIKTAIVGNYKIGAILYDNAGNEVTLDTVGPYFIDTKAPGVTLSTPEQDRETYKQDVILTLKVTEGEDESGIYTATLTDKTTGEVKTPSGQTDGLYERTYTYKIDSSGTYVAEVYDNAGNKTEEEIELKNISAIPPDAPSIDIKGTLNESTGWYIGELPKITVDSNNIKSSGGAFTKDGVPIETTYNIAYVDEGKQKEVSFSSGSADIDITDQGEITITAVNESASGMKSIDITRTYKVDTDKPVIQITGSSTDENGNIVINFDVTDTVSGVDANTVTVNGKVVSVSEPDSNGTVSGSFVAGAGQPYTINAKDVAGNEADEETFSPLDLAVYAVTDITVNSAKLSADVIKGTYDIGEATVVYKRHTSSGYDRKPKTTVTDTSDGKNLDISFSGLKADTVYDYKITAKTKNSGEEKTYTGSFKTAKADETGSVYGTARYEDDFEGTETYPIYVTLSRSGVTIAGTTVTEDTENGKFSFTGLEDGAYQVTASNGKLYKTASVTIKNATVVYPEDFASDAEGVRLRLNGYSTAVVIDDGDIDLTADNMDLVYDSAFDFVLDDDDYKVLNEGGNVLVTLHARYMNVSSEVDSTTAGILTDSLGSGYEIVRYIELYLTKTVTTADGIRTNENISEIGQPITISFPLGEYAGQRIYVASLHNAGSNTSDVLNWNTDEEISISNDYVTITTYQFSVYALYRAKSVPTYTVTWVDGDGNTLKVETVSEHDSATPPVLDSDPVKTGTSEYKYVFTGWEDYTDITSSKTISAQFMKVDIPSSGNTATPTTPGSTSTDKNTNTSNKKPTTTASNNTNTNTTTSTTQAPSVTVNRVTSTSSDPAASKVGTHYSYLGTSASPKTGDEAPIVVIGVLLLVSAAGIVILIRRRKKQ